jgi:hypothetical protein
MRVNTAEINHGTHQLALRLMSANVLLGATNVLMRRCGSERPGPVGSGAMGEEATGYIGGGGGVGPVGELINHPTCEIVESYSIFIAGISALLAKCSHPR